MLPFKYSDNEIEIGLIIEFAFPGNILVLLLLPGKLDPCVHIEI